MEVEITSSMISSLAADPLARTWENLAGEKRYILVEVIRDDTVITKDFNVPWYWTDDGFGINPGHCNMRIRRAGRIMCWRQLRIGEYDFEKLHFQRQTIAEKSLQIMECARWLPETS